MQGTPAMSTHPARSCLLLAAMIIAAFAATNVNANAFTTPCQANPSTSATLFAFCNTSLLHVARASDLVNRLTLDEKVGLLGNTAHAIERLNISSYQWWNEALHGVGDSPGVRFDDKVRNATSFPQVITTASSFNATLFRAIGVAISTEARAMSNVGQAGLTFWAPNVNVFRDPRWGRGQETPGEDPKLSSVYAREFVRGMQFGEEKRSEIINNNNNNNSNKEAPSLKVSACCKHFWGYDVENLGPFTRFTLDVQINTRDKKETYLPPFEACVKDAQVSSIMCSYQANNGVPSCADIPNLTGLLKEDWGFDGYVTGDCQAVRQIMDGHHFTGNDAQAINAALVAGTDIDCDNFIQDKLSDAIKHGYVNESLVDTHLINLFKVQMRLGMFDSLEQQPYAHMGVDHVGSKRHQALALDAARQSIVLLKNTNMTLPLLNDSAYRTKGPKHQQRVVVMGPLGNDTKSPLGNYFGVTAGVVTPLLGLQAEFNNVSFVQVLKDVQDKKFTKIEQAEEALKEMDVDVVVIVIGLDQNLERESRDRLSLNLPGIQQQMVERISKAAKNSVKNETIKTKTSNTKTGTIPEKEQIDNNSAQKVFNPCKVVLVLASGGCVDIEFAKQNDDIDAILWMGYAGQAAGTALADILVGKVNPSGRLTQTWYPGDFVDQVSLIDMRMRPDPVQRTPGRGDRFYTGIPVYPFGYGLSYSTFHMSLNSITTQHGFNLNNVVHLNEKVIWNSKDGQHQNKTDQVFQLPSSGIHLDSTESILVEMDVHNTGQHAGAFVALMFAHPPQTRAVAVHQPPLRKLVGFARTDVIDTKSSQRVIVEVKLKEFGLYNEQGTFLSVEGTWKLRVSHQSRMDVINDEQLVGIEDCLEVYVQVSHPNDVAAFVKEE